MFSQTAAIRAETIESAEAALTVETAKAKLQGVVAGCKTCTSGGEDTAAAVKSQDQNDPYAATCKAEEHPSGAKGPEDRERVGELNSSAAPSNSSVHVQKGCLVQSGIDGAASVPSPSELLCAPTCSKFDNDCLSSSSSSNPTGISAADLAPYMATMGLICVKLAAALDCFVVAFKVLVIDTLLSIIEVFLQEIVISILLNILIIEVLVPILRIVCSRLLLDGGCAIVLALRKITQIFFAGLMKSYRIVLTQTYECAFDDASRGRAT